MLCFFSLLCLLDNNSYYHADLVTKQFQCIHSKQKIPLSKFKNNKCDCCDGSDELLNPYIECKNICPVNSSYFTNETKTKFENTIETVKKIRSVVDEFYKYYLKYRKLLRMDQLFTQNKFISLATNISVMNEQIQEIAASKIGIPNISLYFMNEYKNFCAEAFFSMNLSKLLKWKEEKEQLKKDIIKKSLVAAYKDKYYSYLVETATNLLEIEKLEEDLKVQQQKFADVGFSYVNLSYIIEKFLKTNDLWLYYTTNNLSIEFPGLQSSIIVSGLQNLTYISHNQTKTYNLTVLRDRLFYKSELNESMILKPYCYHEVRGFSIFEIFHNTTVAEFGTPILCPEEYSEEAYLQYIRDSGSVS